MLVAATNNQTRRPWGNRMSRWSTVLAGVVALLFLSGCDSTSSSSKWPFVTTETSTATRRYTPEAVATPTTKTPVTLTWGQRHDWEDGLAVEVSAPAVCKPGQYAHPQGIKRAVKVTVTITNGSAETVNTSLLALDADAQFDQQRAEKVFDSGGQCESGMGMESATVLPGKHYTYHVAYAVGAQPGELQLALAPSLKHVQAVFVGKV